MIKFVQNILVIAFFAVLLFSRPAFAHRVEIFAYAEKGTIYTESYFPDGQKIKGGIIEIYDANDNLLFEGISDNNGDFSFPISKLPIIDNIKIVINAGLGHRNQFKINREEIEAGL